MSQTGENIDTNCNPCVKMLNQQIKIQSNAIFIYEIVYFHWGAKDQIIKIIFLPERIITND